MRKIVACVAVACAAGLLRADVTVETAAFRLVLGDDATVRSLVVKSNGEEMVDGVEPQPLFSVTQDRPFNNELKLVYLDKETTYPANRVSRAGDVLTVGFEHVSYSAKIRVTEAGGCAVFELVGFDLGPKGSNSLNMTYPPVKSLRLLQLPVRDRVNYGDWLNVVWDGRAAVAVIAVDPLVWIDSERRVSYRRLFADAHADLSLVGAKAALVAEATPKFLDAMDALERELGLPRGVESRRRPYIGSSTYWSGDVTPESVDRHIALAKEGGFRMMLIYYPAIFGDGGWDYTGIGEYKLRPCYTNGYESLKEMLAKIKSAGITPGLHILQTFIGFNSPYVTPVADPRLNLKRHFTLAKPLGTEGGDLFVHENPAGCPVNPESCILAFGGELLAYGGFTTERPYKFTGVTRGAKKTNVVAHPSGQIGGLLDVCEFGARSCYIDQRTDLQDEIAEKIAKAYDCGFEFMYCDGSEGVNVPQGVHVANAQYRVWKKLGRKPLFMEGAAKSHFGWHHLSAANAFDIFPPHEFKAMIVRWPQREAAEMSKNFSPVDFGWWGSYVDVQPDMWEFGASRAAAWDCPISIQIDLEGFRRMPRRDDLLAVLRRWEDARAKGAITAEMKERLKSSEQEHHLYVNEKGEYELHDIEMLPKPAKAAEVRGFLFSRGGKRVIAYWHTKGEGSFAADFGEGKKTWPCGKVRYLTTDLSREQAIAAFAAAVSAP